MEWAGQPLEAGVLFQGVQVVPKKVPLLIEVGHGCHEWAQDESGMVLEADVPTASLRSKMTD